MARCTRPYNEDGDGPSWSEFVLLEVTAAVVVVVVVVGTVRNNSMDRVLIKCACGCRKRELTLCRSNNKCGT